MRPRTSAWFVQILSLAIVLIFTTVSFLTGCARVQPAFHIENPYASVDWAKHGQYKAILHAHTTMGGGDAAPHVVIDRYREKGYTILALTDHDDEGPVEPTWPWQAFEREPKTLGMLAIQGNEISEVHHIGSYFNDYGNPEVQSEEEAIEEIGRRGGLAVFNHPGRYNKTVEWYLEMYRRYDQLIGLEIYNKNDRYSEDRKIWDAILTDLLPKRPVWGLSNDDMHHPEQDLGFSWNVIILPKLTSDLVRQAIEQGCFYFVHAPKGHDGPPAPVIKAITVDEDSGTIHIMASGHEYIVWVSQGNIIHRGDQLNLVNSPDVRKYIRAAIYGADGIVVGTQPFQIIHPKHKK